MPGPPACRLVRVVAESSEPATEVIHIALAEWELYEENPHSTPLYAVLPRLASQWKPQARIRGMGAYRLSGEASFACLAEMMDRGHHDRWGKADEPRGRGSCSATTIQV